MDRNYGRNLTKEYLRMLPAGTTIREATKRKIFIIIGGGIENGN